MAEIIRWEDSGYAGGLCGFVGAMEPWAFQIYTGPGRTRYQLLTALPIVPAGTERPESADPEALKAEAEKLLAAFATSLGAVFPAALRQQVQQARDTYYSYALDAGEHGGHERQEALYYARMEVCDEVLGWLARTPAPGEREITP